MEEAMPSLCSTKKILKLLEKFYKDMQDVEFTVENSKLDASNKIWKEDCKICC